jgi:hypothetical protein
MDQSSDRFAIYTFKKGTPFHAILLTPLDTALNQVGDPVEASNALDLYVGSQKVLNKDVRFRGQISVLEPPLQGRNAILGIRFTELVLPNGERLPMNAYVRTEQPEHTWGGELTQGTKPYYVTHRVWYLGEYNQTVMGGPREMGKAITFRPGEHWTLILDEPIRLAVPLSSPTGL